MNWSPLTPVMPLQQLVMRRRTAGLLTDEITGHGAAAKTQGLGLVSYIPQGNVLLSSVGNKGVNPPRTRLGQRGEVSSF